MTFHTPDMSRQLRARFVESRLHMDGDQVVPAAKFERHQELQQELIGSVAVPHYAILDPDSGEFLFRSHLRSANPADWQRDFLRMFERLPERPGG